MPARRPFASRTGYSRSASVFQRLTKCEIEARSRPFCGLRQSLRHVWTPALAQEEFSGLVQRAVQGRADLMGRDLLWPFYPFRYDMDLLRAHYRQRALVPFFHFMKGWSLADTGDTSGAFQEWSHAARLGKDVPWLESNLRYRWGVLGYQASKGERWVQAERVYRLSLERYPENAEAWANLAVCLEKQDRLEAAEQANRMALNVDPDWAQAHYNLAAALYYEGRYAEAWKEVRLAERLGLESSVRLIEELRKKMPEPR